MSTATLPISAVISSGNPPAPATATAPALRTPPAAAPPPGLTKEEADALRAELDEQKNAVKFWYDKATGTKGDKPAAKAEEADPLDKADVLEVLTTKGAAGFRELVKKAGFMSKGEVEAAVNTKAQQLIAERELLDEHPALKDHNSDLFKATALHYGELVKEGVSQAPAMKAAARLAKLDLLENGKMKTPAQKADDDKATKAAEKAARAAAASGDRGGRSSADADSEGDDELTPEQRNIAIRMLAGDGVTEEQAIEKYKARAKAGVRVAGRGTK